MAGLGRTDSTSTFHVSIYTTRVPLTGLKYERLNPRNVAPITHVYLASSYSSISYLVWYTDNREESAADLAPYETSTYV